LNPILWRVFSYSGPLFPSPTIKYFIQKFFAKLRDKK
jgi:hypothetical protein